MVATQVSWEVMVVLELVRWERKAEMKSKVSDTMPRVIGRDLPISAPSRSI